MGGRRGRRSTSVWSRHGATLAVASTLVWGFWASRPQWSADMRLWKAIGDASLVLLIATLSLGPVARLRPSVRRWLPWRREAGIWFGVLAVAHTVLILNGWARWSFARLLGYEFVPQLGRTARMEPGFGLANVLGLLALAWTLALVATSTDRAVRWLGPRAWKWLHNASYTIFYLVVVHVGYFLFIHYTLSFHRDPPPPDWFRAPFVVLAAGVVALQIAAFVITVRRGRSPSGRTGRRAEQARA